MVCLEESQECFEALVVVEECAEEAAIAEEHFAAVGVGLDLDGGGSAAEGEEFDEFADAEVIEVSGGCFFGAADIFASSSFGEEVDACDEVMGGEGLLEEVIGADL